MAWCQRDASWQDDIELAEENEPNLLLLQAHSVIWL